MQTYTFSPLPLRMIVGAEGTPVSITVQSQRIYPNVTTAPFQELPFGRVGKKKGHIQGGDDNFGFKSNSLNSSALFGGGTLPKGFEHLAALRSAQPYNSQSISIRTITLVRHNPSSAAGAVEAATGDSKDTGFMQGFEARSTQYRGAMGSNIGQSAGATLPRGSQLHQFQVDQQQQ